MSATATASSLGRDLRRSLFAQTEALQVFKTDAAARGDVEALSELDRAERDLFDALQNAQELP